MMKSEKIFYLFYFILNFLSYILVIISIFLLNISSSYLYHCVQLTSSCLSLLILVKTRNKPGYLEKDKNQSEEQLPKEKDSSSSNEQNPNINLEATPIMYINLMPDNGCEICHILKMPLRSHHCEKCERCVKGFDHHCWILAGCIGENNRFAFIIFLLFQTISIICSAIGIEKIMRRQNIEGIIYILTLLFSFMCLFGIIFFWIFIYHLFLLFTNQTTYELFNEDQCPYLAIFTLERNKILAQRGIIVNNNFRFRPFDVGFKRNLSFYFKKMCNKRNKIKWEDIYFENLKTNRINLNCCDKAILN